MKAILTRSLIAVALVSGLALTSAARAADITPADHSRISRLGALGGSKPGVKNSS